MNATTVATNIISFRNIPTPDISDWKRRAIKEGCYKYMVDFHQPNEVHYFKTLCEVLEFINKQQYRVRHNYSVWKMMETINIDEFSNDFRYWLVDLSYQKGGIVAYGDQWKEGFYRTWIGRANSYIYKQIDA